MGVRRFEMRLKSVRASDSSKMKVFSPGVGLRFRTTGGRITDGSGRGGRGGGEDRDRDRDEERYRDVNREIDGDGRGGSWPAGSMAAELTEVEEGSG